MKRKEKIRAGTSGWSHRHWKGSFYPGASAIRVIGFTLKFILCSLTSGTPFACKTQRVYFSPGDNIIGFCFPAPAWSRWKIPV